jgi:hypothetical protein
VGEWSVAVTVDEVRRAAGLVDGRVECVPDTRLKLALADLDDFERSATEKSAAERGAAVAASSAAVEAAAAEAEAAGSTKRPRSPAPVDAHATDKSRALAPPGARRGHPDATNGWQGDDAGLLDLG